MRLVSKMSTAIETYYVDCTGLSFAEAMASLPKSVHDWPPPERVKDRVLLQRMHEESQRCGVCGYKPVVWSWLAPVELHHIVGGTQGRSDERTNLIPLCRRCHDNANTDALPFARILYHKWRTDPEHTDWRRLAILKRQFLPEPEGPPASSVRQAADFVYNGGEVPPFCGGAK